ncbi:MAG: peptidoglycan-binding protein [Verrucomicrobiota bacterium]|nr:peptidoglycan-binding protein [Verrucomicrobiota bacterium]
MSNIRTCKMRARPGGVPRSVRVWLVVAALSCGVAVETARSLDDPVTAVQKALRKQHMYFGEPTGVVDDETRTAVKWFQIKEGLKPTGEIDTPTLQALQKASKANAAPTSKDDPAPGSVRERSRQLVESDQKFLDKVEGVERRVPAPSPPAVDRDQPPPPPPAVPRDQPPPPPRTKPPSRSALERPAPSSLITEEDARQFVESYLEAAEAPSPESEISFYADQVDYFDSGRVDRQFITRDQKNYYRRWPARDFELLSPPEIEHVSGNEAALRFRIRYSLRGRETTARGQTENFVRLRRSESGLKIVAIRERKIQP